MKTAVELFTSVPKLHNCAQAVIEGSGSPERVPEMAAFGGGRAPEGMCGALYAATQAVSEDKRQALIDDFLSEMPSTKCRELKEHGVPCVKCVEVGERLAKKYM